MARLLRSAAFVLVGVAAGAPFTISYAGEVFRPKLKNPLFPHIRESSLDASLALQSAVLLRAHPLSGERLRTARRVAERDLARALEEGDAPAAADLRLLVALFAAREGRFLDAMKRYEEVELDDPADIRPQALSASLYMMVLDGQTQKDERARLKRLLRKTPDAQLLALIDELTVAAALGGAPNAISEDERVPTTNSTMLSAWRRADAGLAAVLREEMMSTLRTFCHARARSFLRKMFGDLPEEDTHV